MNKASFDRKYKAVKGHMLEPVVIVTEDGLVFPNIKDVVYDAKIGAIKIVVGEIPEE